MLLHALSYNHPLGKERPRCGQESNVAVLRPSSNSKIKLSQLPMLVPTPSITEFSLSPRCSLGRVDHIWLSDPKASPSPRRRAACMAVRRRCLASVPSDGCFGTA